MAGTDNHVEVLEMLDDGTGPALYAGGEFSLAGGVSANRVARWDGAVWSPLGDGVNNAVYALAAFDDGDGQAIFAGGAFTSAGGAAAYRIAKWNGTSWSPVGAGMNTVVYALAVFDDGGGPALYAAGAFTSIGSQAVGHIAKWDGSTWSALDTGINGTVQALEVWDDGSGPALYAAGDFTSAGNLTAVDVAKWDGSTWSVLSTGILGPTSSVQSLTVFDDGSGSALYAGGTFSYMGHIARWDGSTWTALGGGIGGYAYPQVCAMAVFDEGSGPALYAGGYFVTGDGRPANYIARWNGTFWSPVGTGTSGPYGSERVKALAVFDDGAGARLYAGGAFTDAGGAGVNHVASWDGVAWRSTGGGMNQVVRALVAQDDGDNTVLYAGGDFTEAGGTQANYVAMWNGSAWSALGNGLDARARALAIFDDGDGPALYAAGDFVNAGLIGAMRIAKWDGASWSALRGGTNNFIYALAVFDDGGGPALYAAGRFTYVDTTIPANYIAKWDGTGWSPVGSGLSGPPDPLVYALVVFDDGSGPALYAGGAFTAAGGVSTDYIARWDGSTWSAVSNGMNSPVSAMTVFDDGAGPALYAGGGFTMAGGVTAAHIAKWDGTWFSALGAGLDQAPLALTSFDDGMGAALYAAGAFMNAGGFGANRVAKWNGSAWSPLGDGLSGGTDASVRALAAVPKTEGGPVLYAGGSFAIAGLVTSNNIAQWHMELPPTIIDQPQSRTVDTGRGTGFSVQAVGVQPLSYQWYRDGLPLSDDAHLQGANQATLAISPVTPDDAGDYTVAVSNHCGSVTSDAATLTANDVGCLGEWTGGFGLPGLNGAVYAAVVFDDGNGEALYVGGDFTAAGGVSANFIAKWDGESWSPLSSGMDSRVQALAVYDDGNGAALYAGGWFTTAGGSTANGVAKWDGTSWIYIGGMGGGTPYTYVAALAVFDNGSGAELYAGGDFTSAGGVGANFIAKWNGTSWSAIGAGGMNGYINALAAFDDGSGPALYAGRSFISAGGTTVNYISRWDGSSWSSLQTGMGGAGTGTRVLALAVFGGVGESALYAAGEFNTAGSVDADSIARWDGQNFSAVGDGLSGGSGDAAVHSLAIFNDGNDLALYAGGDFATADGRTARRIARWSAFDWHYITQQPASSIVVAGGSVVFSITVAGAIPSSCQWYKDDVELTDDGNVSGATTTTLTINPVGTGDAGHYVAQIEGRCGTIMSATAQLTIFQPADFDGDGDVDQQDLLVFEECASGPAVPKDPACQEQDFDGDDDVDQTDFSIFQQCISGENNPGDPTCAD